MSRRGLCCPTLGSLLTELLYISLYWSISQSVCCNCRCRWREEDNKQNYGGLLTFERGNLSFVVWSRPARRKPLKLDRHCFLITLKMVGLDHSMKQSNYNSPFIRINKQLLLFYFYFLIFYSKIIESYQKLDSSETLDLISILKGKYYNDLVPYKSCSMHLMLRH